MVKLLSTISIILALAIFPPAALALVSNNAIPGDSTYPIKRGLEDIIFAAASLNPITKAWFAKARSDRRFQEITILTTQGKKAGETLNELVEQTQITADQIRQVQNPIEREKLTHQLSDSITKYNQGLERISEAARQSSISSVPTPIPSLAATPQPSLHPTVSPTPLPSIAPSPSPSPRENDGDDIDKANKKLKEINEKLKREKYNTNVSKDAENQEEKEKGERQKGKEKQEIKVRKEK